MSVAVGQGLAPPVFLQLAGEPLRWRLLRELASSDRKVRELVGLVGERQSLVSYHLGRLREAGMVSMRRSAADRRDAYYSLDLARCGELLAAVGAALHPGLGIEPGHVEHARSSGRVRVLFLCSGNSARSPIAEAILRRLAPSGVAVASGGSRPAERMHPLALRVLGERGIEVAADRRPQHLDQLRGRRFDYLISLCDRLREECPEFPGDPELIHWSIPDPAAEDEGDSLAAFEATAVELERRIRFLLARIGAPATVVAVR